MKAVSVIFEHAILFMFGIVIFISCVSFFSSYEVHFKSLSTEDQLSEVREYVESNMVKLVEREGDSSVEISIPRKAGSDYYKIELSNQGLNVTSLETGVTKHSPIYNLSQNFKFMDSKAISSAGNVIIYKTGNQIKIS